MMRRIGFLVGVCLTVAAFLLVLDIHEGPQPETLTEIIEDPTPEALSTMVTAIAEQVDLGQAETGSDVQLPLDPVVARVDDQLQNGFEVSGMAPDHQSINQSDTGTYLFWSPFRSTWAAQGFAGRLSLATQVPVDVVNTAPGKYRVAFSFQDETERLARIERIETVTGLKLE